MKTKPLSLVPLTALSLAFCLMLCGCPPTEVVCSGGLSRCGTGCADFTSDRRNCGGCGTSCATGQVCQAGACVCQAGATACGGECVITASDSKHCGACAKACATQEVCEQGSCKIACVLGSSTQCGQSCVNIESDPSHCGACGQACESPQSCHSGICTYDVVAACMSNGQITGLQAGSEFKGPTEALGSGPAALAALHDVLLVADGIDNRLYQARLTSVGGKAFSQYPASAKLGDVPNHVLVAEPFIYVANAASGTLQVLMRGGALLDAGVADAGVADAGPADGGTADGGGDGGIHSPPDGGHFPQGLQYATVAELSFGANSYPEAVARLDDFLYVPLYGGFGAAAAAAGQKLVKVDISNPQAPSVAETFDLAGLDLKPFDGGAPVARPFAVIAHQGLIYVALNNLNPTTYAPEGPGLLARLNPATKALSTVDLGPGCLNPIAMASAGSRLYVSCQGKAEYDSSWALVAAEKTGVVALEGDAVTSTWKAACPPDAGTYRPDAGDGCLPIITSRLAVYSGSVYVGDQNGGRIFVLEGGGQLKERRGYFAADGGGPIQACSVNPTLAFSNVSDVIAIP